MTPTRYKRGKHPCHIKDVIGRLSNRVDSGAAIRWVCLQGAKERDMVQQGVVSSKHKGVTHSNSYEAKVDYKQKWGLMMQNRDIIIMHKVSPDPETSYGRYCR
jgi:hypothetical protein